MTLITQETYEEAVRENMELFGCSMEEAITDTIKQFESQVQYSLYIFNQTPTVHNCELFKVYQ